MTKPRLNVCLIGQKFMGKAHSNAYLKADKFFDLACMPVMHTIAARDGGELEAFATRWGWQHFTTDWHAAVTDPDVQFVDVASPNHLHADMAIAALKAGKHVACEKPLAGTLSDARKMRDAARKAKGKTFVWYNYRRVPALALARDLVQTGRIGRIYHVRAFYLQDWGKPDVPLIWRFQKKYTGSGAMGDLAAHIVDMTRFVTGQEIVEVAGAIMETFIKRRNIPAGSTGGGIADAARSTKTGRSDVDDTTLFLARTSGGAVASFEATRLATGNQNRNGLEINGDRGSLRFDFEDMNHLRFYDATAERKTQGWTNIMVTHAPDHAYVGNWWPDAHIIGYEHTFVNQVADMMNAICGIAPPVPLADFEDAYKTQQVLEAATVAAAERRPVKLSEIK